MVRNLVIGTVLVLMAVLLIKSLPELNRYMKMRRM
ncbi:DUF6893 family small protein [Sinosporangium album]